MPVQLNGADLITGFGDYEEGIWTFAISFVSAGDLSVVYSEQSGTYTKVGRLVTINGNITTSTFTHTTATGNLEILGMPFTPLTSSSHRWNGSVGYGGITKTGYEHLTIRVNNNSTTINIDASQEGAAKVAVAAADMPTANAVVLRFSVTYEI